ncbi:MAG: ABC transporter ATP-binding protein/permease [Lacunisphaera sp.]
MATTLYFAYKHGVKWDTFFSIIMALYLCYEPIKKVGYLNTEINRGAASIERLEEVLNEPLTIKDPASPVLVDRLHGRINFEGVTFAYGETPALKDVTVAIKAGTTCALVGPSGAGKSTFANLGAAFLRRGFRPDHDRWLRRARHEDRRSAPQHRPRFAGTRPSSTTPSTATWRSAKPSPRARRS